MKRVIKNLIGTIILFVVCSILAYCIRQFIEVFNFNFTRISWEYIKSVALQFETYKLFVTKFDPPNVLFWLCIGYFWFVCLFGAKGVLKRQKTFEQIETYGSHGTARWSKEEEIKKNLGHDDFGWFIGDTESVKHYNLGMKAAYHSHNNPAKLNMQAIVVGPPGSNKSTAVNLPNMFHIPYAYNKRNIQLPDMILTDPKAELYDLTSNYYRELGYDVRVLDFIHLKYGDQFNSIDFITGDKELLEISKGYVRSVQLEDGGKISGDGKFWVDQSAALLGALIGYVQQIYETDKKTFTEVAKLLTSSLVGDVNKARKLFENAKVKGAPLQLWNNFLTITDSDKTRASVMGTLATDLTLFAVDGVQNITSRTTIDITQIGIKKEKPIILYLLIPDGDRTYAPVINVIVNTVLTQLYKTAYFHENVLPVPVYLILEEAFNVGYIPGLLEKLGTMRGRRIYPLITWQDLVQIKIMYGDSWESIIAKCDLQMYLGVNDKFTADYVSELIGKTTIQTQGVSTAHQGMWTSPRESESFNYQQRPLLFPDEVRRFDNLKYILYQRGLFSTQIFKTQYRHWMDSDKICKRARVFDLKLIPIYKGTELSENIDENENQEPNLDEKRGTRFVRKLNNKQEENLKMEGKFKYRGDVNNLLKNIQENERE